MIIIGNEVLSDDIKEQFFLCDLEKCKGACCVAGDLGAPLEDGELPIMHEILDKVLPYLPEAGQKAIKEYGPYILDEEDEYSTTTVGGAECAFVTYDADGTLKCGIEQAYLDGKIAFQKPISCHLYPIRITKYDHYNALNYDRWDICSAACALGKKLGVPVYKFLKGPLVRKFGEAWYAELVEEIEGGK